MINLILDTSDDGVPEGWGRCLNCDRPAPGTYCGEWCRDTHGARTDALDEASRSDADGGL